MNIANQGFPATRADLNNALQALVSNSSGSSAPSTIFANQFWYDTTNEKFYIRNETNNAWILLFELDQTNNEWQIKTGVIQAADSDGLALKTDDGTTRLFIKDSDGAVIIGDTSASTKFKIKGTGDLAQLVSTNAGAGGAQIELKHESASPANGDSVGLINFGGFDAGSSNTQYASLVGKALDTSAEQGALDIGIRESSSTYSHTKYRFDKDGLKFNGDTAVSNGLSDYEEGHHTAVIYGDTTGTGNPLPIRSSHDQLAYTKIGRVVHVQGKLETLGSHSATGNLRVTLPKPVASLNDVAGMGAGSALFYRTGDGIHYNSHIVASMGGTNAIFYQNTTGGDIATLNAASMDNAIEMFLGLTYISSE